MLPRRLVAALALVVSSACNGGTTDADSSLEYRAPVAGSFTEVFSYTGSGPKQCFVYSTLSGTVRVKLRKAGDLTGADAGVDLTERVVGAGPPKVGCGAGQDVRAYGEWTAPIESSGSQLGFNMSRTASGQTTTIRFDGSLSNDVINGTLTFSRSAGALAGNTPGSSAGTATFPVSLKIGQVGTAALAGTWTGTLGFSFDAGSASSRATTLVLTQSGTSVKGQLQFAGGEIDTVDGTVSGSTLAITATPVPMNDACPSYSFGVAFTLDASALKATAATGTACESGGQLLRGFTGASGTLTR
jgi:hypothetical protein